MHRYLLVALALFALSASAQDWTAIPLGTSGTIRAIENTSFSVKYAVGDGGYVSQSNNDRTVWTPVSVGTSADLFSIVQPSLGQAWVSGVGGVVRVRDTAGTWHVRDIPSPQRFVLFTRSSGEALAAGSGGSIWKSENGGVDWALQNSGTTTPLHAGWGGTFGVGFAVGDDGLILTSNDQGANWAPLPSGTTADLYGFDSGASGAYFAVGANGTILKSTDDGATWSRRIAGTTATFRALSRSKQSASALLAVGDDGTVIKSTDNGETWCLSATGTTTDLYAVEMVTNSEHVVAGEGGLMLRSTNGGGTCVPAVETTLLRIGTGSIPAGGGPLQFSVTLHNTTGTAQTFQAWVDAVLPGGSVFGPFLGPQALTLGPGQTVGPITFTKNVPANAPAGTYTVRLRAGLFPSALFDSSTFNFGKVAALHGAPVAAVDMRPEDWSGSGEGASFESAGAGLTVPSGYTLSPAHPNPVRGAATLTLEVADTQPVRVAVYDVLGRPVRTLYDGVVTAGVPLPLRFDAADWPSGVYVVRAEGAVLSATRSVVVVR